MMLKYFVTGASGQLGHDLLKELNERGYDVTGSDIMNVNDGTFPAGCSYVPLDICDREKTLRTIKELSPDIIIHCAAWTNVDAAEENEELVRMVNVKGTENIALAAKETDAKLIYISTDYVFDGKGQVPFDPDQSDFKPLNVYGTSKLEGERCVSSLLDKYFIVRTSWVFGRNGNNFVKTMLRLGKTHDNVKVVNDQIGTPTYTPDLARLLADMSLTDKYGCYHVTNSETEEGGYISWYDFAKEIFRQASYDTEVIPVSTEEYGLSKAVRPLNSRLDKQKLIRQGFKPLPDWKDALSRYLKETEDL